MREISDNPARPSKLLSEISVGWFVFLFLVLVGSILWARSRDPFRREEFNISLARGGHVRGITIVPKHFQNGPVVIYAHGSGGSWLHDGNDLRHFTDMGLAAVGFDYDQADPKSFETQFSAVLNYVGRQSWVRSNAVAWVGFSLGAQHTLDYAIKHPRDRPQLYVRLSGAGWIPELDPTDRVPPGNEPLFRGCQVLIVHGEQDEIFPVKEVRILAERLRSRGVSVTLHTLSDHGHTLFPDQPVVLRLVAEFCKAKLTPDHPLPEPPKVQSYPFFLWVFPGLIWLCFWVQSLIRATRSSYPMIPFTKFERRLWSTSAVLFFLALTDTALHLVPLHMSVTPQTISISRAALLAPEWREDFEMLSKMPIWHHQRVQTLIEHVELSHYTVKELVNWRVDADYYRQFVLSPVIIEGANELNWRRTLWEKFYLHIKHETTTSSAAKIVVRILRDHVTIAPSYPKQPGVKSMWTTRIVSPEDFEVLYAAALRSVGVPARLNEMSEVEFWTGNQWETAPQPVRTILLE